jgi:release factor glutamine methyltransferase
MTRDALFRRAARRLAEAGLPTPDLDARFLIEGLLALDPGALLLCGGRPVADEDCARVEAALLRRLGGEPVDRILGCREFWGLTFRLSPATLSPRPDTETVVAAALAAFPAHDAPLSILDLGTGSGAILVALLAERPSALGLGVDRSFEAAATARANAQANGVGARAAFLVADWAEPVTHRVDLVVSNPPYIPSASLAGLQPEVRDHDPRLALDGGPDGLDAYRQVTNAAERLLRVGGALVLELGVGQEAAVAALAGAAGLSVEGPSKRDLGGVPRALTAWQRG